MTAGSRQQVLGIIPARFNSFRFPGKPLAAIAGKSLIQRTYENAKRAAMFTELVVATDDARIYDHVQGFGGRAVMTPEQCPTGSHRAAYVLEQTSDYDDYEIVVNVQGDEPCVAPVLFEDLCKSLQNDREAVMATAMTRIHSREEAESTSVVKCVSDQAGNALYFSRALIPAGHTGIYDSRLVYHRHIGIYAYCRHFLLKYAQLTATPLRLAEDLEQLAVLEHGYRIKIILVDDTGIGVDTPQDILKVEALLCKQNFSSLPAESAPR